MFEDSLSIDDNLLLGITRRDQFITSEDINETVSLLAKKGVEFMNQNFSKQSLFKYEFMTQRPNFFHKEFPRKATSLDTQEHYLDVPGDFLLRWFPREITKIIFPALYFEEMIQQLSRDKLKSTVIPEFTASPVPTINEEDVCKQRNGVGIWNRDGIWICTCSKGYLNQLDGHGPKFFQSYNEWLLWDQQKHNK